jgi:hypothetical protein
MRGKAKQDNARKSNEEEDRARQNKAEQEGKGRAG